MKFKLAIAGAAMASMALIWGVSNAASPAKAADPHAGHHEGHAGHAAHGAAAETAETPLPASVDNFMLADQNLDSHELYRLADAKAVVIVTHGNGCPVMRNTNPAIKALRDKYKAQGVEFLYLNSNLQDKREAIVEEAKEYGYDIPILMDVNQLVGEQLGVTRTAEVFVIDPKSWKVVYRGPVDDRVTYERQKAKAEKHFAADALDALMAGRPVAQAKVQAAGCLIDFPERAKRAEHAKISYVHDIAPIVREKCVACHQPGGIGPMTLTNYEMIKGFSPMIREVIRTDRMPPYHADPSVGKFHDDKSLSPQQIKTLVHWIEAGAPRGEGEDPLAKVKFEAPEWPLGKPDLVLDIPAYDIPETGIVDYQRPAIPWPLTEGRWLRASTIKVEQRQGVHHILTGYMKEMPADGKGNESRWGASVGGYAVGSESTISPDDVGTYVPGGGAIGFQNHYTPFGKAATDRSKIALYFYPEGQKPKMVMRGITIMDPTITIPANTARHKEVAYLIFPKDALLYSAFPHAHYRGHSSDLTIEYPDGTRKLLLSLPKYDFNWQRAYEFAEPIKVPAGSRLIATYTYDNSKRNPANPDPEKVVTWGDQSFEEMFFTALRYRWVEETSDDLKPEYDQALQASTMLGMMDDNLDRKLQLTEARGRMGNLIRTNFAMIDTDKDGGLSQDELAAAQALMGRRRNNLVAGGGAP
ncbi:redoxin family protein [Phenylobacterium terrae]|uniref:Redoxin family protein n=1 Tax=Phenylobacterium terrae TaxID=2665495 RepID=A0ABW4MY93_9CAUL